MRHDILDRKALLTRLECFLYNDTRQGLIAVRIDLLNGFFFGWYRKFL